MSAASRRAFVCTSAAAVPIASATADESKIVVALVGVGGMGSNHLQLLLGQSDVEVAYVCDADRRRLDLAMQEAAKKNVKPQAVADMRRAFDDKRVDAVFIATPDHWHTPAALLALDAGKHVYVEKPCCHNIAEGGALVHRASQTKKLVQVGTQSRSTDVVQDAMRRIAGGAIGEILVAKAWNSQRRGDIGKTRPAKPPAELDFDLWLGPAPEHPYRTNLLPGNWRWWRPFGCGDVGNDGVHDLDVTVWGLGVDTHPVSVACLGGKYRFDDDQEFPDTQYAVFEYAATGAPAGRRRQLIFEQRIWSPYVQEGYENGAAFYGAEGMLVIGHSVGWKLYGPRNKLLAERTGGADLAAHHRNFFEAIRGQAKLNAEAKVGHLSATLVHLANISARVQRTLTFDPIHENIVGDDAANAFVRRDYRQAHWGTPKRMGRAGDV